MIGRYLALASLVVALAPLRASALEDGVSERFRFRGKGGFVVGGVYSRQFFVPNPQVDPFFVMLPAAPAGAALVKAYANWSYMTNFLGDNGERTVVIDGVTVGPAGTIQARGDVDLNWGMAYGVSYTADITPIVAAGGFNRVYTIAGAVDDPNSGGLAQGFSIVAVYSDVNSPLHDVRVYSGYTSTRTGEAKGTMTFDPYIGGPVPFFLNAIDGQKDVGPWPFTDDFYLNGVRASIAIGGENDNAWQGRKQFANAPGAPNYLYDHAELDVANFMLIGDNTLVWDTDGFDDLGLTYTDSIAHSFAAIAVPVAANAPGVSGRITLQDFDPDESGQIVRLDIVQGDVVVESRIVVLGPNGNFSVQVSTSGAARVYVKGRHWLRERSLPVTLVPGQSVVVDLSLPNGDADDDNEVMIGDFAILSAAFGSSPGDPNWHPEADFNGDEEVSIGDFAILSANFGMFGW